MMSTENHRLNRRTFLTAAAGGLTLSALPFRKLSAATKREQPNVLFIAVDDLRCALGCYGDAQAITPNFDRLAARGMLFERAYCQFPVCGPSRASVTTGLYPDTSGVYWFENADSKVPDCLVMSQYFKNNGYRTARFGKIFNNPMDFPDSWDEKPFFPTAEGYTWRSTAYALEENKKLAEEAGKRSTGAASRDSKFEDLPAAPSVEMSDVPDNAYPDGWITGQTIRFMTENKDRPFFVGAGFIKPHLPLAAPKKYWDMYDPEKLHLADNQYFPKNIKDFMATDFFELRAFGDIPREGPLSEEKKRELTHGYYACVSYIDAQIGRLLDSLDDLGLTDSTLICLWGDNGFHLGENNIWAKHVNWEFTNRLPLIFTGPGVTTGSCPAIVEFLDMYPTLADMAGLPIPAHCEGKSLAKLLEDPDHPWDEIALSQYQGGPNATLRSYSIRTDRYRYAQWRRIKDGRIVAVELYDLKNDPQGNVNIAKDPASAEILEKLARQLQEKIS
jgi:arylsulfatase A-like enzyme